MDSIVAIGASAGGLEALPITTKPRLPVRFYICAAFKSIKSILPYLLSKVTQMKVQDIDDMEK
jgi:two-component system CheB/CheR fusion protein